MAAKPKSSKKAGSTRHSGDAGEKDLLIAELKDRVAFLENELTLKQDMTSQEITRRKRAEEELRESEKNASQLAEERDALTDIIPAAIWVSRDADCKIITGNALANLYTESDTGENISAGSARGEVYSQARRFFKNGRELKPEELPMQEAVAKGIDVADYELDVLMPSGKLMTVLGNARPLRNAGGQVRGCVSLFIDITERKRMEAELLKSRDDLEARVKERTAVLKDSEEKLRSFVNATIDGIILLGTDGRIIECNSSYESITGLSKEDIIGHYGWDVQFQLIAPARRTRELYDIMKNMLLNLLHSDDPTHRKRQSELSLVWRDGKERIIQSHSFPVDTTAGRLIGVIIRDITRSKQAEKALQESEERYRALVEMSPDAIIVHRDGRFLYANPAALRLHGADTLDQLRGMSVLDMIHPDDRGLIASRIRQMEKGLVVPLQEARLIRLDGEQVHFESTGTQINYGEGKAIQVVVRDITLRKRAEDALRKSEARLVEAQRLAKVGDWEWDLARNEVVRSKEMYAILGIDPEQSGPVYEEDPSLFSQESLARLDSVTRRAIELGEPYELELELIHRDGSRHWVSTRGEAVRDGFGRVAKLRGTLQDVTERKRADEAVRKSEEKYRELVENANSIILRTDRDGNITYFNEFSERFFGYSRAEIIGRNSLGTIIPASDSAGKDLAAMLDDLLQHPEEYRANTHQNMRKNGELVWVTWTNKALYDEAGKLAGLLCIGNDITQLKRAEDALKEAKQQAELYVDLMGHDISNMNQIALGYLELAWGLPPGVQQGEMLEKPIEVLQRSSQLIRNVRKLQKVSEGLIQTHEVDVGGMLSAVQREFGGMPGKRVTLNFNCHKHCYVQANELLHDVFANLVSNAIKHTGDRADIGIDLDVVNDSGRQYCRVNVEDNGPGIPDDYKGVIFNRVLKGTKKAKGMGLGLYLVKSLVEGYGGRVWVEDRVPGDHTKGARFVVYLPAIKEENAG